LVVNNVARKAAAAAVLAMPLDWVVEIKQRTRSTEQNSRMWAMLTEVSRQVEWYGQKLTPEEWKEVFTASLKKQKVVPGIDGGFVVLGARTSTMTRQEHADLTMLIEAFGAERGVRFEDPLRTEGITVPRLRVAA
jgi:hypothetical protein